MYILTNEAFWENLEMRYLTALFSKEQKLANLTHYLLSWHQMNPDEYQVAPPSQSFSLQINNFTTKYHHGGNKSIYLQHRLWWKGRMFNLWGKTKTWKALSCMSSASEPVSKEDKGEGLPEQHLVDRNCQKCWKLWYYLLRVYYAKGISRASFFAIALFKTNVFPRQFVPLYHVCASDHLYQF